MNIYAQMAGGAYRRHILQASGHLRVHSTFHTCCFSAVYVVNRELLGQNPENIRRLMQQTIANELSPTRSPNNMMLITVVFQQSPDLAAKVLFCVS